MPPLGRRGDGAREGGRHERESWRGGGRWLVWGKQRDPPRMSNERPTTANCSSWCRNRWSCYSIVFFLILHMQHPMGQLLWTVWGHCFHDGSRKGASLASFLLL
jgi:hypothetical protein